MTRPKDRELIYDAIDGERDYQDSRWGSAPSGGKHTVAEYILYIEHHLAEARKLASTQSGERAREDGLDQVRKIITLGVACMEDNGIVWRVPLTNNIETK